MSVGEVLLLVTYKPTRRSVVPRRVRRAVPERDVLFEMAKIAASPKVARIGAAPGSPRVWCYVAKATIAGE